MKKRRTGALKTRIPAVILLFALFVFVITNLISYVFFRHIPHIHDEIAYLFQSKIFLQGRLYVPSPCGGNAFDFPHMINNGKWYSQYPPGYPLLLLIGLMAGMPWIVNPLLAALAVIVLYYLGREIYGEKEGRLAAFLGAISIWFLMTSSTMLSHTGSMFFFAVFLLYLCKSLDRPSLGCGLTAGLALGVAFLIRPFNVAVISIPFLVFYGLRSLPDLRRRLPNMAGLAAVFFMALTFLLAYNTLTNGHPLSMGYVVSHGGEHGLGFGRQGYLGIPHTPERGILLIGENLGAINKYLFGWPFTSLLFMVPFFLPLKEEKRFREADGLMVLGFLALMLGLFFYWGTVIFIGPRMYFEAFPLLILMTARGMAKSPTFLLKLFPSLPRAAAKTSLSIAIGLFTVFGLVHTFPRWVNPPGTRSFNRVLTRDFAGTTHRINKTLESLPLGRSLIIMRFLYTPKRYFPDGWWSSGFLNNDPGLENKMIYAQDKGAANAGLFRCYPDRKIYLFYGTLQKAMLLPLEMKDGRLQCGRPISFKAAGRDSFELVTEPQALFTCYSEEFRKTLDSVFADADMTRIDVIKLGELAAQAEEDGDPVSAAHLHEAALQIENDPLTKVQILGRLARLYGQVGRLNDAARIRIRLSAYDDSHVYEIFPEKGF
jgi:hypothetical protein